MDPIALLTYWAKMSSRLWDVTLTWHQGETLSSLSETPTFSTAPIMPLLWLGADNPGDLFVADIFWGLLTDPDNCPLMTAFHSWGPFVRDFGAYAPLPDPPLVTLFYQKWFHLDENIWVVSVPGIVLCPQGVAAR